MRILIIEDESHAARLLIDGLERSEQEFKVQAVLDSVRASLNFIEERSASIDLIFMDIELADGTSFEIFKHTEVKSPVIFTTAYDQYALEAFKVNAIDYLLKPIVQTDLERALKRVVDKEPANRDADSLRIKEIVDQAQHRTKNRCLVKKGGVFEFVNVLDIALAYSEDSLTFLHTYDGKRHVYSRTIEQLYAELDHERFFQISRAQIVQIDNILQVHPYLGQRLKLSLKCSMADQDALVSRQRATEFKVWLDS